MTSRSAVFALILLSSCASGLERRVAVTDRGCVASPEPRASAVGAEILRKGGNAVDAAVATFFALAVTFPNAGNLGGGGFMMIHAEGRGDEALDYRETAPGRAHPDLYLDKKGEVIPRLSLDTHLAAGVPGSVMGMWEAHRKYGSKPWKELLAPAIALADGYALDEFSAKSYAAEKRNNFGKYYHAKAGETFVQKELAATLRRIAERGPEDFYRGETARLLVAEMKRGNGVITLEDLAAYRAVWRRPVTGSYRGHAVVSMPPPSSGGVALLQLLNMLEIFPLAKHNSPEYIHRIAEIEKRVFADRSHYLGDPDFYSVPVSKLIDKAYAAERARDIAADRKTDPSTIAHGGILKEGDHTTHFSAVDRWGNAVANTMTLNDGYGSGIVVEGAGFLLNDEMDDFSAKPGVPNMYGVIGAEANKIEPRKRMLSSMSPTFVYSKEGRLWLVLGTPGGPTIFTSVFQVIVNRIDHGMTLAEAVAAPRFHHQWPPPSRDEDPIVIEKGIDVSPLSKWYAAKVRRIGDVHAIEISDGKTMGAGDPRGIGKPESE